MARKKKETLDTVELDAGFQQDALMEMGQDEIKQISELKDKYLKRLTADLEPSKNQKKQSQIKNILCVWKHIDAYFVANDVCKDKETDVTLTENFGKREFSADIQFSQATEIPDLFGGLSAQAKFKKDLFNESGERV